MGELSRCFAQLLHRIEGFIQREQDFTRFASHELRSPLMVMRSSLDLLQEVSSDHATMEHRALARIDQALKRMERLTDSFLWLSRETPNATCLVDSETFEQLLQQYIELIPEARESIQLRIKPPLNWMIHPFVLSVILENLLNNARLHGTGKVMVQAQGNQLTITNPLPQAETAAEHPAYSGFGYGLASSSSYATEPEQLSAMSRIRRNSLPGWHFRFPPQRNCRRSVQPAPDWLRDSPQIDPARRYTPQCGRSSAPAENGEDYHDSAHALAAPADTLR